MILGLTQAASSVSFFTGNAMGYLGMTALSSLLGSFVGDRGQNEGTSESLSRSLSREHRDFTVNYCEKLIDKHI